MSFLSSSRPGERAKLSSLEKDLADAKARVTKLSRKRFNLRNIIYVRHRRKTDPKFLARHRRQKKLYARKQRKNDPRKAAQAARDANAKWIANKKRDPVLWAEWKDERAWKQRERYHGIR